MYGTALATVASFEDRCRVTLFTIEEDCVKNYVLLIIKRIKKGRRHQ